MKKFSNKLALALAMITLVVNTLSGYAPMSNVNAQTREEKSAILVIGDSRGANLRNHLASKQVGSVGRVDGDGGWIWVKQSGYDILIAYKGGASDFSMVSGYAKEALDCLTNADSVGPANKKTNIAAYNMLGLGYVTGTSSSFNETEYATNAKKMVNNFWGFCNGYSEITTKVQCTVGKTGPNAGKAGNNEQRVDNMIKAFNSKLKTEASNRGLGVLDVYSKLSNATFPSGDDTHWDASTDTKLISSIIYDARTVRGHYTKVEDDKEEPEPEPEEPGENTPEDPGEGTPEEPGEGTPEEPGEDNPEIPEGGESGSGNSGGSGSGSGSGGSSSGSKDHVIVDKGNITVDGGHVIVDNVDEFGDMLEEELGKLATTHNITEVYSLNNQIGNAYYKPKLEDIPELEARVLKQGFASAYTGYWDLNHTSEFAPAQVSGRPLEILGADFALAHEGYIPSGGSGAGKYVAIETPTQFISYPTAIMNIYKALGEVEYDYAFEYESRSKEYLQQSPAIKGMPGYMTKLSGSKAITKVFVTRSNVEKYKAKAMAEMKVSQAYVTNENAITGSEFIVMLMLMMDQYGEPVINADEMSRMLQVYGGNIPSYLNGIQQQAYMYLKAKGCLNDDTINFSQPISLQQMLDILVCVADEGSRTTYKNIQITMDIGDALISKGYFPKTVNLVEGNQAIRTSEEFDYSTATHFDYYIKLDSNTEFKSVSGNANIGNIIVPVQKYVTSSGNLAGVKYLGIVRDELGNSYYHLVMPTRANAGMAEYLGKYGNNLIQVNTTVDSDKPAYIELQYGGGIYTYAGPCPTGQGGIVTTRATIPDEMFEGAACLERCGMTVAKSTLEKTSELITNISDRMFKPMTVSAATENEINAAKDRLLTSSNGVGVKLTIYNAEDIESYATDRDIPGIKVEEVVSLDGSKTLLVTLPTGYNTQDFLSSIKRYDSSQVAQSAFVGIANIYGDVLVPFSELVARGKFYDTDNGILPTDVDGVLTLESVNGLIKLNQNTREIVVGNTIYRVSDKNTVLWEHRLADDGQYELWVDFRVAYGWTENILDLCIAGTGDSYEVNISTREDEWDKDIMAEFAIDLPTAFDTDTATTKVQVVKGGVINSTPQLIMSAKYPLANWFIYQASMPSGETFDCCIVAYPKGAFPAGTTDDSELIRQKLGYIERVEGWIYKMYPLSKTETSVPGKFTYNEKFGYLYNLPDWETFTMDKYLSGEYILPVSFSNLLSGSRSLINANVIEFEGYKYGTRPVYNGAGLTKSVDIHGNIAEVEHSVSAGVVMTPAPAGVVAMYGSTSKQATTAASITSMLGDGQISSSDARLCYYGTSKSRIANVAGTTLYLTFKPFISEGDTTYNQATYTVRLADDVQFYLVNKQPNMVNGTKRGYVYSYVTYVGTTIRDLEEVQEPVVETVTEIIDAEQKDKYEKFEGFSLEYVLNSLDEWTTWVILIVLYVFPIIGIIGLTLLLGFAFIGQNKIFVKIFQRTVDPVKFLTAGAKTIDQLDVRQAFIGLIMGYIGFGLLLDGNIIKIIMYLSEVFEVFTQLLRQL